MSGGSNEREILGPWAASFDMALRDIVGQDRALRMLYGMLKRDRVPAALLFSGETGVGKRLTAVNLAKTLNCLDLSDSDCCDKCTACKKIASGIHPDVVEITPENEEIRIDAIRKIEETLSFRSYEGRRKVVIIDGADAMNINAANAFLKTLEEPPSGSLIILVSSNPDALPDTIRSRCTNIRFHPLPMEVCNKLISGSADVKNTALASLFAMGRPGLALTKNFAEEKEWFAGLLNGMLAGETKSVWADKAEIRTWVDMSFILLRDMVVREITGSKSGLVYDDVRGGADVQAVMDAYQRLQKFRGLLDFNLNKSISWNYVASIMRQLGVRECRG